MNNINPQQIINMLINNSQLKGNPIFTNAMDMFQKGDNKGLQQLVTNICNERGIKPEEAIKQIKSQFGIK